MHLSIHPQNLKYPSPHIHIKSDKLGIHEDVNIDENLFFPEYWLERVECLTSLLNLGSDVELSDSQIIVLPNLNQLIVGTNNRRFFNLNSILDGTFYMTKENRLPLLVRKLKSTFGLGASGCFPVGFTENKEVLLPLDKGSIFSLNFDKMFTKLLEELNPFTEPFNQAFNKAASQIQNKNLINPQEIIPRNIIHKLETIKRRKPNMRVIRF